MAVFSYLKFVPSGSVTGQKYEKVEIIWNQRMRVSNWIEFVFWEFDRQFTALGGWQAWPGAPVNNAGGNPSLRASMYARFIEDSLAEIEANVASFCTTAEAKHLKAYGALNAQGMRQWTGTTTDPAWYNSAFGPGG